MSKSDDELEKAALKNVENFGQAPDFYVDGYGWILKDGQATDAGIQFYLDHKEDIEKNSKESR